MLERKSDSHKGENGKVLVIGGSEEYVGAPALTGLAALRAGADLVYVACPEKVAYTINALSPDLITIKLSGDTLGVRHTVKIMNFIENVDVVAIGPGLGTSAGTQEAVKKLCSNIKKPKVIDADALKAIKKIPPNSVITPHRGEFETMFGVKPARDEIMKRADKDKIILLKGPTDFICNGSEIRENHTGNAGMTVGGTGDILTGIVAGLIAQKVPLFDAAFLGAQINGEAGDILREQMGYCFVASDLLSVIPRVILEEI